ncbi:MAG: DUF2281 domain-containing protein [Candidatus Sericytochromatia bacterium]|nr:DUF2281 domain-containing protein [Candidatus Sericytochromatia bacterium]
MSLTERIENLPPDIREEVLDFMEYLLAKRDRQNHKKSAVEPATDDGWPLQAYENISLVESEGSFRREDLYAEHERLS